MPELPEKMSKRWKNWHDVDTWILQLIKWQFQNKTEAIILIFEVAMSHEPRPE